MGLRIWVVWMEGSSCGGEVNVSFGYSVCG